jgi:hypothetical protein
MWCWARRCSCQQISHSASRRWPPAALTPPRRYDQWLPDLPDLTRQMTAFLMANWGHTHPD